MDRIEQMLVGNLDMREFISFLNRDKNLVQMLRQLVPQDAVMNRNHPLWKQYNYEALEKYDFDLYELLLGRFRFDGTIGDNLNIFGCIRRIYCYQHPEITCTEKYKKAFLLYLDVTKDCFDGPEVSHVVEEIINQALTMPTKKQQIAHAKSEIISLFHVVDKKYPRWIQGPEWPMGAHSPMMFIEKRRKGEAVYFEFCDYDTSERKTVVQWY